MSRLGKFRKPAGTALALCGIAAFAAGTAYAQNGAATPPGSTGSTSTTPTYTNSPNASNSNSPNAQGAAAHHGLLGIHFEKSQATQGGQTPGQPQGLTVSSVDNNSPASVAGVRQGDRVVGVDGFNFPNPRQLKAFLHSQGGRPITLQIDRGGQQQTLNIFAPAPQGESGWVGVLLDEGSAGANGPVPNPQGGPSGSAQPGSAQPASHAGGARVSQVYPGGPAASAGIRPGDVILQVNGHDVPDAGEFVAEIHEMKPQSKVELAVQRGDQKVTVPVTLGDRSSVDFGRPQVAGYNEGQTVPPPYGPGPGFQAGFPGMGMLPEQHRQLIEQNQRIEQELRQLRDEVKQLREQLQKK